MELIRSKVIDTALSQIGYQGSTYSSKYSKDLDAVKFYNYPKDGATTWCSIFVDWCVYQNTNPQTVNDARYALCEPNTDNCGAGCQQSAQYFRNAGRWYPVFNSKGGCNGNKGDKVFFKTSSGIYHTGLLVDWNSEGIYTVEGSTGGAKVLKRFYYYSDDRLAGFGRPRYSANDAPDNDPTPAPDPTEKKYTVKVGDYLSIRTGPSTSNKKVGELINGAVVTVIEQRDGWGRITGDLWVSMNYLK